MMLSKHKHAKAKQCSDGSVSRKVTSYSELILGMFSGPSEESASESLLDGEEDVERNQLQDTTRLAAQTEVA